MSISDFTKLQLCLYPHPSNHFMAHSKPSILCFLGLLFFFEKIMPISKGLFPAYYLCLCPYGYLQTIFFLTIMAISICRSTPTLCHGSSSNKKKVVVFFVRSNDDFCCFYYFTTALFPFKNAADRK